MALIQRSIPVALHGAWRARRALWVATAVLVAACSPTLDWREVRVEGDTLRVWLPCKPERRVRELSLDGVPVAVELLACTAGGTTWGVSSAPIAEPGRVAAALRALRASRLRNLDGRESGVVPLALPGVAPRPEALRFTVMGRRPDGSEVTEHAAVFAHGGRVFHAAALGGEPSAQALETLFGNLKPRP